MTVRKQKRGGTKVTGFRTEIHGRNQGDCWLDFGENNGYFYLSYNAGRLYCMRAEYYKDWGWKFDNEDWTISFTYKGTHEDEDGKDRQVKLPVVMRFVDEKTYRFVKNRFQDLIPMKPVKIGKAKDLVATCESRWKVYKKYPRQHRLRRVLDHLEVMSFSKAKTVQKMYKSHASLAGREANRVGMTR